MHAGSSRNLLAALVQLPKLVFADLALEILEADRSLDLADGLPGHIYISAGPDAPCGEWSPRSVRQRKA